MNSFHRFTIAFWGGQAIGAAGVIAGMILMVKHQSFSYLIGGSLFGLIIALLYVSAIFKFIKVKS